MTSSRTHFPVIVASGDDCKPPCSLYIRIAFGGICLRAHGRGTIEDRLPSKAHTHDASPTLPDQRTFSPQRSVNRVQEGESTASSLHQEPEALLPDLGDGQGREREASPS